MDNTYYKRNKQVRFQIIADTGETLGLPLITWKLAETTIEDILNNKEFFKELCPDTDINLIKYLEIIPTIDY